MKQYLITNHVLSPYSKFIHERLSHHEYEVKIIQDEESLKSFLETKDFIFTNVTIPFKETVIKYLDEVSPQVKSTNSCNLIINRYGKLYGYNTDYYGFVSLLNHNQVDIRGCDVLILGTGGTAKTVYQCLKKLNARRIFFVSRYKLGENIISYQIAKKIKTIRYIVNCSPVDMYPNEMEPLIDINDYPQLKGVIDVIYNPYRTHLLIQAKKKHILSINGLYMLLMQAKKSQELVYHRVLEKKCEKLYRYLKLRFVNIVLMGMPGAGKSTAGRTLAKILKKTYYDVDYEIKKKFNKDIKDIFVEDGEEKFREAEVKVIERLSKKKGVIIALGGGSILREENIDHLMRTSIIIFLNRDIDLIKSNQHIIDTRPLLSGKDTIDNIYHQRIEKYLLYADIVIDNNGNQLETIDKILKVLL